jgi:hypothetical protein
VLDGKNCASAATDQVGMDMEATVLEELSTGYELGKSLLKKATEVYSRYSIAKAQQLMQRAQQAYRNPYLASYLRWKYPQTTLLSAAGQTYPVAVYPAPAEQRAHPESVLKRPLIRWRQRDDNLLPQSAKYRALAHRLGLEYYDRPCFTMARIRQSPTLSVECELGSYLRALDTCDEFAWEIFCNHEKLTGESPTAFALFDKHLPFRSRLHSAVDDPVCYGQRRSAAVAASALIAFYDDNQLIFLVKRRSRTVAVHQGMVHVVPSFMFQPATGHLEEEFSVTHNFEREYLEELFNRKEPEEHEGDWQYFYGDTRLEYLRSLISAGKASLTFTGLAVNLLNLRPEICLLLLIKDPDWYEHHRRNPEAEQRFKFNDEWLGVAEMGHNAQTAVARIKNCRDDADLLSAARINSWDLVPPGAAALWLGKRVLDEVLWPSGEAAT